MFSAHSRAGKPSPFSKRASQSSGSSSRTTRNAAASSRTASLPSACGRWSPTTLHAAPDRVVSHHSRRGLCPPTKLQPDLDLVVFHDHLVGAEGDVREGEAPPCRDVVLEAVPGAGDDLAVVHPLEPPIVLRAGDQGA